MQPCHVNDNNIACILHLDAVFNRRKDKNGQLPDMTEITAPLHYHLFRVIHASLS